MKNGSVISVKNAPRNAMAKSNSGSISAVMSKLGERLLDRGDEREEVLLARLGLSPRLLTHASMLANACGSDATNAAA